MAERSREFVDKERNGNAVDLEDPGTCGEPRRGAQEQIDRVHGKKEQVHDILRPLFLCSPLCMLRNKEKEKSQLVDDEGRRGG